MQDSFTTLSDNNHPVVFLKDVSEKYLLLILEYAYCGHVDLQPDEVEKFKEVAEILQIEVKFTDPTPTSDELSSEKHLAASDKSKEIIFSNASLDLDASILESVTPSYTGSSTQMKIKLNSSAPPVAPKRSANAKPKEPEWGMCIYCDLFTDVKDLTLHYERKDCWEKY